VAMKRLRWDTLGLLAAGDAGLIIDAALDAAMSDLVDRADEDGKPRTVNITVELKLVGKNQIDARVQAAPSLPKRRTSLHIGELKMDKGRAVLAFSDHAPEDPRQRTIQDVEDEGRPERG
jgi:hypothetical protein